MKTLTLNEVIEMKNAEAKHWFKYFQQIKQLPKDINFEDLRSFNFDYHNFITFVTKDQHCFYLDDQDYEPIVEGNHIMGDRSDVASAVASILTYDKLIEYLDGEDSNFLEVNK